jgi:hypothetical protein
MGSLSFPCPRSEWFPRAPFEQPPDYESRKAAPAKEGDMSKFILIDHSLDGIGGHYFEYALHVLKAAERAGFEVVLATNRRFQGSDKLSRYWTIRPVYELTTHSRLTFSAEIERPHRRSRTPPLAKLASWWNDRRRRRRIAAFARDTATLFGQIALAAGDQVFLPTVSELDFLGLAHYLARDARTRSADWHVQFHSPIYKGCEPDYPSQDERTARLRRIHEHAVALVAEHRLHLYTTTDRLTAQHNRLGNPSFQTLPYPVNPILQTGHSIPLPTRRAPLKVAYLGDARHEKGYQLLPALIERMQRLYRQPDRVQFVVQSNFGFPSPARGKEIEVVQAAKKLEVLPNHQVRVVRQSTGSDEFCQQALDTDIGLLPYDRQRYAARCSGVLVELLSAGVPVLVSAGCWMADQLADATRDYHIGLRHNGRVMAISRAENGRQIPIPPGARDLLLFFVWPEGPWVAAGTYARVETRLFSHEGREIAHWTAVVGPSKPGRCNTALVRLPSEAVMASVARQDAYGQQPLRFVDAELCFLAADPRHETPTPFGAVGLVAADPADARQTAVLLNDLVENHRHYRETACQFARRWSAYHNADRVVAELLSRRQTIPLRPSRAVKGAVARSLADSA